LHLAAILGRDNMVRLLLDHGADVEALGGENDDLRTALDMACGGGHVGTIKLLLDRGAKVHLDVDRRFPFDEITDTDLLARLLNGAGAASLAGERGTKLIASAVAGKNKNAADLLIARGAQLDIFSACALGRIEDVGRLLEATPELLNAVRTDYPGGTPITVAVEHGHVEIVRLLIAKGAKLPVADEHDMSALPRQAIMYGHLDVLQLLLASGYSPADKDQVGSTLLHTAAIYGRPEIASYLISAGADVNATDSQRATPLHVVGEGAGWSLLGDDVEQSMQRTVATAKILLEAGADVHARDASDSTPLHQAAQYGLAGLAELLFDRGADVNARNARDETPLGKAETASFLDHLFGRRSGPLVALLRRHGGVR
jgi:ankyrin repeat protein